MTLKENIRIAQNKRLDKIERKALKKAHGLIVWIETGLTQDMKDLIERGYEVHTYQPGSYGRTQKWMMKASWAERNNVVNVNT